ncbi:transposase [Calothrix parasitica NIES-267]|uniref:Transposase n=1 Tax=Calothrix parasitica NIES-267 TaxID=1973488 RepID=A0A1Z4LLY2_9CYAN|nr:transposase [Calothrix parasitica NIES-267]
MLELSAAAGEIDLKYLDESGFCMWSEPSYTYYHIGEQKRLELSITPWSQIKYYRAFTAPS